MNQNSLRARAKSLQKWGLPLSVLAKMIGISPSMTTRWTAGEKNLGEENYDKMVMAVEGMEGLLEFENKK